MTSNDSNLLVGVKITHSADFSDAELLENDSSSAYLFEEWLEDDSSAIQRSFPRCSTSSGCA
jgi:hypothetical protein